MRAKLFPILFLLAVFAVHTNWGIPVLTVAVTLPPYGVQSVNLRSWSVFQEAVRHPALGSSSLLQGLSFHGGSTLDSAAGNLLRAAIASLLDSAHPGVSFPRTPAQVIGSVDAALASGNRETMLTLAAGLDADNNLGCPLN
jgi:hypothetical protein